MSSNICERPNVFEYDELQRFLTDMVFFLKVVKKLPKTKISKRAQFGSPSYLKMVMDGQRNLSAKSATQLAKAMELTADETQYFLLLTQYYYSESAFEKEAYRQSMLKFRDFYELKEVDRDYYELFSSWYATTIFEFIGTTNKPWSIESLAAALHIEASACREALALLERLNLVKQDSGNWQKKTAAITTPKRVESKLAHGYTREMLMQALQHLKDEDMDRRNYQALTVALTQEQYKQLTERIWNFMLEINRNSSGVKEPDAIYQLNVQLFSLLDVKSLSEQGEEASPLKKDGSSAR